MLCDPDSGWTDAGIAIAEPVGRGLLRGDCKKKNGISLVSADNGRTDNSDVGLCDDSLRGNITLPYNMAALLRSSKVCNVTG